MTTPRAILYSAPFSMFGAKAEIAALEKGLDVALVMVAYEPTAGYQPKHPEVALQSPRRRPGCSHGAKGARYAERRIAVADITGDGVPDVLTASR